MNTATGDCRGGDELPLGSPSRGGATAAVHGGKASKGRKASRGNVVTRERSVRKDRTAGGIGGNVMNPMVGYALQHTRPDREEEAGEVA